MITDTLAAILAINPLAAKRWGQAAIAIIADITGTSTPAAISKQGIVASPVYGTTMTLDGRVASVIRGGRLSGAVVLGVAGASGGALGGKISNVVFEGDVSVVRGAWVFENCTIKGNLAVGADTTLVNCAVVGTSVRTAGTALSTLCLHGTTPSGTWTVVAPA